jgi:cold shock CspA family protein
MGRGNESFGKKELHAKKEKKRKEKETKKSVRKQQTRDGNNLDDMIAYVDEFGRITSAPPDLSLKKVINADDIELGVPKSVAPDPSELIRKGVVTFFNDSKGFGFIRDTSSQQSIFVHIKAVLEPIKENNKVTFEVVKGAKGPNAINVKIDR